MQDYTAATFEQVATKTNASWTANQDREDKAAGNIAEQTRLGFLEMKTSNDLAFAILDQRSAQNQPQVGVLPKV